MKTGRRLLTKEERDVLTLGALQPSGRHLSNREIGHRLGISTSRVKSVIHQACVKLEANNRNQAVFFALRQGEINLGDLFTLSELAEILCSLDPNALREIAHYLRQGLERRNFPLRGEQIIRATRKEEGILTNRERDVLILSTYGLTNDEMAESLCMSPSSVRTFLYRAFKKLGAHRKADAVLKAVKKREISIGDITPPGDFVDFLVPLGAESIDEIARLLDERLRSKTTC